MRALLLLLALAYVVAASPVAAQSSGGSFGSSGFGGGGGGGGGGGSSGGGESSGGSSAPSEPWSVATWDAPDPSHPGSYRRIAPAERSEQEQAGEDGTPGVFTLGGSCLSFLVLSVVFVFAVKLFGKDPYAAPRGPFEVRQISVAFDWTRRAELQSALHAMAARFDGSASARAQMSREAGALLGDACDAARYAAFQTFRASEREAESRFHALAGGLRARYRHELAGARAEGAAPELRARPDEGEGLVVVSMVVAWRGHLPPLPKQLDPAAAASALKGLVPPRVGREVVALEVIWSPAAEADRMSSAELELLYPELVRLDGRADVGRCACRYCRGVFPAELGRCPGCGAPLLPS